MKQRETRNLTMMMDLYEMTMANGYFNDQDKDTRDAFDVFYRSNPDGGGFAIFAGLEQILEYIENLLCEMSKEQEKLLPSPHALAIEFYSPFYLLLSMSDGTDCKETKEEIAQRYMRYIDDFFQKYFS